MDCFVEFSESLIIILLLIIDVVAICQELIQLKDTCVLTDG